MCINFFYTLFWHKHRYAVAGLAFVQMALMTNPVLCLGSLRTGPFRQHHRLLLISSMIVLNVLPSLALSGKRVRRWSHIKKTLLHTQARLLSQCYSRIWSFNCGAVCKQVLVVNPMSTVNRRSTRYLQRSFFTKYGKHDWFRAVALSGTKKKNTAQTTYT